ncbi:MAG: MaoC family dehydratase [Deltaproteobacteria bacterium]|nr:MaoC family dehydratase [Deltaproteobacteria bacterium]MBW2085773.1 MaoC family dehydratase [Deltaproteobacteria bacterium]
MEQAAQPIKTGQEIPSLIKTAYMPIDPDERNPIHTDDYAKKYGMRGALVGGAILLSYVLEMLYNYFGQNWLYYGKINVSFVGGGAINGDVVTSHGLITALEPEEAGTRLKLDVWLENQDQSKIVVGEASCIQQQPAQ